jgi:hypothetical protein
MQTTKDVFVEELTERIRPLNNLMYELQSIGLDSYIRLPQIAVVGEQSTGKEDNVGLLCWWFLC